jgi:hypothetical protein
MPPPSIHALWLAPDAARALDLPLPDGELGTALDLEQAVSLCRWLRARRPLLLERPVEEIIAGLGQVADCWLDARGPWLGAATTRLAATTGYASAVLARSLRHCFRSHRQRRLRALLVDSLGDPRLLDAFSRGGRQVRAYGPALTLLSAAGNVPVAALPSLFHALLVKSPCLARVATAEPFMLPRLARSLWEVAPELGGSVAVLAWPREEAVVTARLVGEAEAVIATGSDATLAALRAHAAPRARFIGYGHRVGFGVIGRERLGAGEPARAAAAAAAVDVATYDQQGCMSPRWFYVEAGGETSPEGFAALLAEALERLSVKWPRRLLSPAEASAVHQFRAAVEVRSDTRVWASPGTGWTVLASPAAAPEAGCLNRVAWVQAVPDVVNALPDLAALAPFLQTVAVALSPPRQHELAARLAPLGVTRFCPLGKTQFPPPNYHHDGRRAIAELVRWVEVE